jgi:hypothetical protein
MRGPGGEEIRGAGSQEKGTASSRMSNETAWKYQLRFLDPITVETARPQTAILADKPALQREVVCGTIQPNWIIA